MISAGHKFSKFSPLNTLYNDLVYLPYQVTIQRGRVGKSVPGDARDLLTVEGHCKRTFQNFFDFFCAKNSKIQFFFRRAWMSCMLPD